MSESAQDARGAMREAIDRFPDGDRPRVEALEVPRAQDLRVDGTAHDELRWAALERHIASELVGQRVLVVGSGTGYDALAFAARRPKYVLACESSDARKEPSSIGSTDHSGVDFRLLDWEALDPAHHGTFDIVHCDGLLHRVLEPMALLRTIRRMTAPGGTLLIGSMMLADPERSEYLRFIPDRHAGDPTCWFVPGRLAIRWLLQTAGFEVEGEFGEREGPAEGLPVVTGYLRAVARQ